MTGTDKPDTPAPSTPEAAAVHALIAERREMAVRIEELRTEKMRRQVTQMEVEGNAEAEALEKAVARAKAAAKAEAEALEEAATGAQGTAKAPAAPKGPKPVPAARPRLRHWLGLLSFVIMVIAPTVAAGWYLWTRAQDRYVSYAGFSVRTEEIGSALDLLGGVGQLSGSSSSDTDILYDFIQSPELVARIDAQLDLRTLWARPGADWADPGSDPVYAYKPGAWALGLGGEAGARGSIEDLTDYWLRMVKVYSDSGTGLIDLEVQAFDPDEAREIARAVYAESSAMINRLSAIARDDATSYARDELEQAVERLKTAREALTRFRNRTQIVDPSASIQGQMGLLSSLQAQLAQTLIDLDILRQTAQANDPRITQAERRVEVIEERIEAERRKLGFGLDEETGGEGAFADLLGDYERLAVDLEFAEQSYTAALTTYDGALAEAQRQTRYLAAHVNPTLPESPTRPDRITLTALVALFAFLIWTTTVLVVYALRDRR